MKQLITVLLMLITISGHSMAQPTNTPIKELYAIVENGLWGFIDKSGTVVIEPKFLSVGEFSEGLAPVRLNGTYGYIDKTGAFIIQPKYDVAYSFNRGQAKVYIDGKPYYITKAGEVTFEHNYSEFQIFDEYDLSIVKTEAQNYGVINRKGQLVLDTIYKKISPFSDGLSIVTGHDHNPYSDGGEKEPVLEIGVVNTGGDFIVPFGEYRNISPFKNGFARVELDVEPQNGYYDDEGVIDASGNLKFIVPAKKWRFYFGNEDFSEDLATVSIYSVDPETKNVWSSSERNTYKGVVNDDGEIIFSDEDWDEITPFVYNRAFVQDINDDWYLIDTTGQILNKQPYREILYSTYNGEPKYLWQNAIQFVETDKGWGAIDTTGAFVVEPRDIGFFHRSMYWRGKFIFTQEDISVENPSYSFQYGIWDIESGLVFEPQFHRIRFSDYENDLIFVIEDGRDGYIDHQGNYIWREKENENQNLGSLNIDFMNRGYFYASSPYKEELAGLGGWGGSGNDFARIFEPNNFESGKLNLLVNPNEKEKNWGTYEGIKMYIANTTQDTVFFDAQDSRLYLKIQALDKNDQWKDIEYLPSSWCGNSYHAVFLPPGYYWEFVVPKYEGEFKTKLRAELMFKKHNDQKEDEILYSNEFEGGVNPGQFWRKRPYYPSGIMDPYFD